MAEIECEVCKSKVSECPHCHKEIEQALLKPLLCLLMAAALLAAGLYLWHDADKRNEEAVEMRKRILAKQQSSTETPPRINIR